MPREPLEESSSQRVDEKAPSTPLLAVIRTIGMPVAVIVAAMIGGVIANSFQRQISGTTLLSERERAETQLRASMFSSLIQPIGGAEKGADIDPDREQLLVELLALNFHEHFELKPLFEWVYQRRVKKGDEGEEARRSLRSIARRIIGRQIAALRKEGRGAVSQGEGAKVYELTIVDKLQNDTQEKQPELLKKKEIELLEEKAKNPNPNVTKVVGGLKELMGDLTSPDKEHTVEILVTEADWKSGKFRVKLDILDAEKKVENSVTFGITPFDFPFTDNTVFPDGNRFSLTVHGVDETGGLRTATLRLIWFPKHYYTPRERPLSHHHFLKLIGKK